MKSGGWKWASKHPFLTTILALSALGTIEYVIRGPESFATQRLGVGVPDAPKAPPPAMQGVGSPLGLVYVIAYAWDGKGWIRKDASWKTSGAIASEQATIGNGAWTYWCVWLPSKAGWHCQLVQPGGTVDLAGT